MVARSGRGYRGRRPRGAGCSVAAISARPQTMSRCWFREAWGSLASAHFSSCWLFSFAPVPTGLLAMFNALYRSGGLVFGGGHVVLPLLRDAVVTPGWVSDRAFLAGHGAAQAAPGPLFTFAAYLGAVAGYAACRASSAGSWRSSRYFCRGFWRWRGYCRLPEDHFSALSRTREAAMRGVNAAVVSGFLGSALYNLVGGQRAVREPADFAGCRDWLLSCSSHGVRRRCSRCFCRLRLE